MKSLVLFSCALWCGGDHRGLGAEDFFAREAASRRLAQHPIAALPLVYDAARSKDPEVRMRARELTPRWKPLDDPRMLLLLRCENEWEVRAAPLLWDAVPTRPQWPDWVGFAYMCRREGLVTPGALLVGECNEQVYRESPVGVDSDIQLMRERFVRYKYPR